MFRGSYAGCKTREEFVEEIADVYISKVNLLFVVLVDYYTVVGRALFHTLLLQAY